MELSTHLERIRVPLLMDTRGDNFTCNRLQTQPRCMTHVVSDQSHHVLDSLMAVASLVYFVHPTVPHRDALESTWSTNFATQRSLPKSDSPLRGRNKRSTATFESSAAPAVGVLPADKTC